MPESRHDWAIYEEGAVLHWNSKCSFITNVRIGVRGGESGDECACLVSRVRCLVFDLCKSNDYWNAQLKHIAKAIAFALGAHRQAVIELNAPMKPDLVASRV